MPPIGNEAQRVGRGRFPARGTIEMWLVSLVAEHGEVDRLVASLSRDETARAARFRFVRDMRRYQLARGRLREILAGYLGVESVAVPLATAAQGKPMVDSGNGAGSLYFNLSHSGDHMIVAVATDGEIGVDMELFARRGEGIDDLARRVLAESEQKAMADGATAIECRRRFLRYWTAKEAYLKGRGDGLAVPLDTVVVSFPNEGHPRLVASPFGLAERTRWYLRTMDALLAGAAVASVAASFEPAAIVWR